MVSGLVAAPLILPRPACAALLPKGVIDTNTVIEMKCPNYPNANIFYATDGSRPTPRVSKTINSRTMRYKKEEGILLHQGKRVLKALCVLPDGRESNVITKSFYVRWVPSESDEEELEEEEIRIAIEDSRKQRLSPELSRREMTTRNMSGRRSVGGNLLIQRSQTLPSAPSGISTTYEQYTHSNPRVVISVKMNATTGPVDQLKENPLGEEQFLAPPPPKLSGNLIRCTGCGRVNNPDARFCDWCGMIPGTRMTWESVPFPIKPVKAIMPPKKTPAPKTKNTQTQTVGLFYPGGKRVDQDSHQALDDLVRKTTAQALSSTVSSVSPGNGKWQDQLDHINHHLRAYTAANHEFREMFADPRLGPVITAKAVEHLDEVDILLTFPVIEQSRKKRAETIKKSVVFGSTVTAESNIEKPRLVSKTVNIPKKTFHIPAEERILISELQKKKCSIEKIEEVLIAGADPNCADKNGVKPIAHAIINRHYDAAMLLLRDRNLDLNWFHEDENDTALHLIVKSGESLESLKVLDKLLGRNIRQRENKKGYSPLDLALKYGYDAMANELESDSRPLSSRFQPTGKVGTQVSNTPGRQSSRVSNSSSREKVPAKANTPEPVSTISDRSVRSSSKDRPLSAQSTERPHSSKSNRSKASEYSAFTSKSTVLDEF